MTFKYKMLLILTPAVFLLDQITKGWILHHLGLGEGFAVIPGYFDIIHVRNSGAAFGMFANSASLFRVPFFYGVSIIAIVALTLIFKNLDPQNRFLPIPLSLVTGGVMGNLLDRIRFGNVVDFLSFHVQNRSIWGIPLEWPAFNVADSAITVSMVILAVYFLRTK